MSSVELDSMTVKMADKTAFAMEGLGLEIAAPEEGKPMEIHRRGREVQRRSDAGRGPAGQGGHRGTRLPEHQRLLEMAGSWQPTDGRLALSQYDIAVENAGTIGMTFDSAATRSISSSRLQELQKRMAEAPGRRRQLGARAGHARPDAATHLPRRLDPLRRRFADRQDRWTSSRKQQGVSSRPTSPTRPRRWCRSC